MAENKFITKFALKKQHPNKSETLCVQDILIIQILKFVFIIIQKIKNCEEWMNTFSQK